MLFYDSSDVDLQIIGKWDQLLPCIARHKVVESDFVAVHSQLFAGCDHPFIDGHVFLDLDHRLFRRQQLKEPLQQHVVRAIDECAASIAHRIQSHHVQCVDDAAGASFQIGVESVFFSTLAEQ